jgi:GTP-binding protein
MELLHGTGYFLNHSTLLCDVRKKSLAPNFFQWAREARRQSDLKISAATFIKSASKRSQWPNENLPQIAFAGRSNVGKSSAINRLLGRKNLVKISKTPGHTRTLNFFKVNEQLFFVDLPGYGYAKVPLSVKEKWGPMIESFLLESDRLVGVIVIIDSRMAPTADDLILLEFLTANDIPTVVIATKSDKLKASRLGFNRKTIEEKIGPDVPLIMFSSTSGKGKNELWKEIKKLIEGSCSLNRAHLE